LKDTAHDVDRCIMPVEEGCGGNDADVVPWFINLRGFHGQISHS